MFVFFLDFLVSVALCFEVAIVSYFLAGVADPPLDFPLCFEAC